MKFHFTLISTIETCVKEQKKESKYFNVLINISRDKQFCDVLGVPISATIKKEISMHWEEENT